MARRLTQKQEKFARFIFGGMEQRQSYIEAGYSSKSALSTIDSHASRLASNGKVLARLAELRQKAEDATIGTVQEREKILTEIYRGKMSDYLGENQRIKQGESLDSAAIQEVTTEYVTIGRGENAKLAAITKIKLLSSIQAIAEHNKMQKIYTEGGVIIDNRTLNINVISDKGRNLTERLIEGERTSGDNDH